MAPSLNLLDGLGRAPQTSALAAMGVPDTLLAGSSGSVARMQANAVVAAAAPLPNADSDGAAVRDGRGRVKMFASIPADDAAIKAAPVPYRGSALYVLFTDLLLFIWEAPYIPTALVPLNLNRGAYPFQDMTWHGVVFQLLAIAYSLLVLPVLVSALVVGVPAPLPTLVAVWAGGSLFLFVQGPEVVFGRNRTPDGHPDEAWFFINGVATTPSGSRKALARFRELFGRNVVGINNRSLGPLADIAQCLIQRDLRWPTRDASAGYEVLKAALNDVAVGSKKKVVLIAHSQGGIIASAWVDQLLADFSREVLGALEVYTFASAASHFSAPLDSAGRAPFARVEHFAHTLDYVSRIGVLAFTSPQGASLPVGGKTDARTGGGPSSSAFVTNVDYPMPITSTFFGLLFVQPAAGHLICTHYLGDKSILHSREARKHSKLASYLTLQGASQRRK